MAPFWRIPKPKLRLKFAGAWKTLDIFEDSETYPCLNVVGVWKPFENCEGLESAKSLKGSENVTVF